MKKCVLTLSLFVASLTSQAATVADCAINSMRPYYESGLMDYITQKLQQNSISMGTSHFPIVGLGPVTDAYGNKGEAYAIHFETSKNTPVEVFSSNLTNIAAVFVSLPKSNIQYDNEGNILSETCTISFVSHDTIHFVNTNTKYAFINDYISYTDRNLAIVDVQH